MAELKVRYAAALFELTTENGTLDTCLEQALVVRNVMQGSECLSIMQHPHISNAEKREFLHSVFSGKLDNTLNGFLDMLIVKNRESLIVPALTAFIDMGDHHKGKVVADVVSAVELTGGQVSELKDVLSKKLGKQVEISSKVDPSLIGGLYINVDGWLIDRTIKTQLKEMKNIVKKEGVG